MTDILRHGFQALQMVDKIGGKRGLKILIFGARPVESEAQALFGQSVEVGGLAVTTAGAGVLQHPLHNAVGTVAVLMNFALILGQVLQQLVDTVLAAHRKRLFRQLFFDFGHQLHAQVRKVGDEVQGV